MPLCATDVVRAAGEKSTGVGPLCATLNAQEYCPCMISGNPSSIGLALLLISIALPMASAQKTPIQITADLSDAPRKLLHADVDLPVTAGPLALTTPKWIPGTHMPSGPVEEITGVVFTANGQTLAWRRDDVDLYQFHLTHSPGRNHAACAPGLHRYVADFAKTCRIRVGIVAALPGQHAGARYSHSALGKSSRGLGNRYRAYAGQLGFLPGSRAGRRDAICSDECGATAGLADRSPAYTSTNFRWLPRSRPNTILMWFRICRRTRTCAQRCWPR